VTATATKTAAPKTPDTSIIVNAVLAKIGRPEGFFKGEAKHLFDNRYRVNIWATKNGLTQIVYSEYYIA